MNRFRRLVLVAVALVLALGVSDAGLFGAGKTKAPKPPKKSAPKVQPHNPMLPKPKNPKTPPKKVVKKETIVHNRIVDRRRIVERPHVYVGARFERAATRELSFHRHWWWRFYIYPRTVAAGSLIVIPPPNVNVPDNITVNPPVIKPGQGLPLSPAGKSLAKKLDGLDVANHWLTGQQVDWKTGNSDGGGGPSSNGGAFVAAVCVRLKVPLADPDPENFLPASQYVWLLTEGKDKGWVAIGDTEAQLLANQGWVVIAVWKSPTEAKDPSLAGQAAIIRPSDKPATDIAQRGPRIIMASVKNHNDIALKDGFPAQAAKDVLYLACKPR